MNGTPSEPLAGNSFIRQVLTVAGVLLAVVAMVSVLWATIQLWFALLLGILLALFLRSLSNRVERHLKLRHPWALALVVIVLLGALGLTGWMLAAPLAEQFHQLQQRLPDAWKLLWKKFYESPLSEYLPTHQPAETDVVSAGQSLIPPLTNFFRITIAFVVGAVISIFLGLYLALNPTAYRSGLLRLFPVHRRPRLQQVLEEIGGTLSRWIFGQLLSMLCVAVLIGLGLYFCGIPLSLAIGLIAGLLDFIPFIGPILAAIPAVLLGLTVSPWHALLAVLIFVIANQIEGHLLMPLIHRYSVWMPPAVTLFALALMTALFGLLGTLLAIPIAAIGLILIKRLYVEDVLGDHAWEAVEQLRE